MTAILGFADLLGEDSLTPAAREEYLGIVRRNGHHLLTIINDILDLSKMEADRLPVRVSECDPRQLCVDVVTLMQPKATERGLALVFDVAADVPQTIHTDPQRLRQILVNLISNAVKFTPSGRVSLRLRPAPDSPLTHLVVEVADTGIGMTPEQLGHLFEPFWQGDDSHRRTTGGTGPGLAISRRLCQLLGGDLVANSQAGKGSVFTATLRIDLPPSPGTSTDAGAEVPDDPAKPLSGRVLLVEDGADNRRLVTHFLESWGIEVVAAENGQKGVELALQAVERDEPFGLILMDVQMPVMDGLEAVDNLRGAGYGHPIVALTAHAIEGASEHAAAVGFDGYLLKPIDARILRRMCARHLKRA